MLGKIDRLIADSGLFFSGLRVQVRQSGRGCADLLDARPRPHPIMVYAVWARLQPLQRF
jgi:hypothetical protein